LPVRRIDTKLVERALLISMAYLEEEPAQEILHVVEDLQRGELRLIYARDYLRGSAAVNATKTHCNYGHEFTPENTVMRGLKRACRTCRRHKDQLRSLREKEARKKASG
jgi:hypothetical protein